MSSGKIHPSEVRGKLRTGRTWAGVVLGAIFLGLPWIRISGRPALLFDVPGRRFSILGHLFWAQDVPLLLFLAGGAIVTVMFLTAVFGRVWCGWACPQTVFIDLVFRRIEKWTEGDAVTRRRQDAGPFDSSALFRKSAKWALFILAGAVVSHSVLAYFVGTERLLTMVASDPLENPEAFAVMLFFLSATVFNFGWFRERFCTHVCPYGRLQTVLLDERSWVVAYDAKRGDCIDCGKCVAVCPTGIDIRRGLQLECIACTACIDACNPVMRKIGKPEHLIRYGTTTEASARPSLRASVFRPRPLLYAGVIVAIFGGFSFVLRARSDIDFVLIRATGVPFELIVAAGKQEQVLNHFYVDLHNRTFDERALELNPVDEPMVAVVSNELPVVLKPGERRRVSAFIRFPRARLTEGAARLSLQVTDRVVGVKTANSRNEEVSLVGPY